MESIEPSIKTVSAQQRIESALHDLEMARMALDGFARLDIIVQATRDYVILRQVEMSDDVLDYRTYENLTKARLRAMELLPALAQFTPLLGKIEQALLAVKRSLYHAANCAEIDPQSRKAIWNCRTQVGHLLADLDLAVLVLTSPDSVFPSASDFYNPDFTGTLHKIESVLANARIQVQ